MIVLKYSKFFLVLTQSPPKTACYTSCPPVKFLFHNSPVFAFSTHASTVDWERRNQRADSKTPSQMRRTEVDTMDRQRISPTAPTRSQVTSAQVETYPMRTFAVESQPRAAPRDLITSPVVAANRQHHTNNNVHEADPARVHQDGHSIGESPLRFLYLFFFHISHIYMQHKNELTTVEIGPALSCFTGNLSQNDPQGSLYEPKIFQMG